MMMRFIPACAGNTQRSDSHSACRPVHPRLRGEHTDIRNGAFDRAGSSPPARGTLGEAANAGATRRFIPACAGNTRRRARLMLRPSVHPRLRGEHPDGLLDLPLVGGSSPPARGTRAFRWNAPSHVRFIPACAGNTECRAGCRSAWPVHPRLRGEHRLLYGPAPCRFGSSPPARGTRVTLLRPIQNYRFIPACAGNTMIEEIAANEQAVHPRLRGEHQATDRPGLLIAGSSPPARGTRERVVQARVQGRFIPACAGNTSTNC